jgi:L-aspartate oxidase
MELPPAADASVVRILTERALGIVRDHAGLKQAIHDLEGLAFSDGAAADPALVTLLIATAALKRQESRGGHWRCDFPQRSPRGAYRQFLKFDSSSTRILSTWSSVDDRPLPAHAHA